MPVILPSDVQDALEYLASAEVRRRVGISVTNTYLFANTGKGLWSS